MRDNLFAPRATLCRCVLSFLREAGRILSRFGGA